MRRSASAATASSCVTTITVDPCSAGTADSMSSTDRGRGRVEVAGRLVGEYEARLVRKRPGDRDALLLAAAEGAGSVPEPIAQADRAEKLARAGPALAA